ncbi:hypothetical protein IVG45_01030 [Methylomonas sp. LL1]|uniref:hypothetical protein n=1 Tax=Methylomonas sp. LL1 TaxID=2785785 RepID=UPI0018C391E1|nr:hypothetical protein [Methylomonas sp. LL1]QPK63600.1 hypothetical protein IVG45_01030 [Methylomonas sp. LL1]
MDTHYEKFEIATVIRDFWLVDSDSYQRKYRTGHEKPLVPGFYIVNWPDHIRERRFNEHAEFHGPFGTRQQAQATLEQMQKAWKRIVSTSADTPPMPELIDKEAELTPDRCLPDKGAND